MKNTIITLISLLLFSVAVNAQTQSDKIDSIYVMQKEIHKEIVINNEPLDNKRFGVEINIFNLLYLDKEKRFSGTFSLFDVHRDAEIAFPFFYANNKNDEEEDDDKIDLTIITLDCHYRYFLGKHQNGFYIGGFARYAYLEGILGETRFINWGGEPEPIIRDSENKLGLGISIGYRIFSHKGFYWGVSLGYGRYLTGNNDRFRGEFFGFDDDSEMIFDIELLKFGWSF